MTIDTLNGKQTLAQVRQQREADPAPHWSAAITHDLVNYLSVADGCISLLLMNTDSDRPAQPMLTEAASAINRCTLLAQHMQELSHMTLRQPEKVCVNDVISGMAGTLHCLAGREVELMITCAPNVGLVHAVPQEIERILLNLVVNACQAIGDTGTIAIVTSNAQVDHVGEEEIGPEPYVMISVSDDGTGMDEETRARLFEPFFTTREDGTGLGLAIVHDIVARSRGHVQVESEPGQGTTFRIYLPRIDDDGTVGRYTRA